MVGRRTKQEVSMINKLKQWLGKYISITVEFNQVDIDTVDYDSGYVAVATSTDGTKITVYEREDWFCLDPIFAYTWEKNVDGVASSGSERCSYYKLKDYKFKAVKVPNYDEWYKDLRDKEVAANELCKLSGKSGSYACMAKAIKEGRV